MPNFWVIKQAVLTGTATDASNFWVIKYKNLQ